MSIEEALRIVETNLAQRSLKQIEEIVFRHVWEGLSYSEIAAHSGYDTGYIKNVGSNLWKSISKAVGERVTKNNVQFVLKHRCD